MIFQDYVAALPGIDTLQWQGRVRDMVGLLIASDGPAAAVGDFCEIRSSEGRLVRAQVVGFRDGRVMLMPPAPEAGESEEPPGATPAAVLRAQGNPQFS